MNELIAVHAPAARLAEVDGVEVLLLSVELWTQSVFVHLAAVETLETDRLTAEHEAAIERWAAGPKQANPPEQPGARLGLSDLTVADDAGTRYRPHSGSAAGTGTEWRAQWSFAPAVPPGASRLTVAIGSQSLELAL